MGGGAGGAGGGSVEGDGFADVIVGAPFHDAGAVNGGAAYLYYGPLSGHLPARSSDAKIFGSRHEGRLGITAAGAGDVNGDGFADVLLDSPEGDPLGPNTGVALLFYGQ